MTAPTVEVSVPADTVGLVIIQLGEAGALDLNFVTIDGAVPLPRRQTAGALRRLATAIEGSSTPSEACARAAASRADARA